MKFRVKDRYGNVTIENYTDRNSAEFFIRDRNWVTGSNDKIIGVVNEKPKRRSTKRPLRKKSKLLSYSDYRKLSTTGKNRMKAISRLLKR